MSRAAVRAAAEPLAALFPGAKTRDVVAALDDLQHRFVLVRPAAVADELRGVVEKLKIHGLLERAASIEAAAARVAATYADDEAAARTIALLLQLAGSLHPSTRLDEQFSVLVNSLSACGDVDAADDDAVTALIDWTAHDASPTASSVDTTDASDSEDADARVPNGEGVIGVDLAAAPVATASSTGHAQQVQPTPAAGEAAAEAWPLITVTVEDEYHVDATGDASAASLPALPRSRAAQASSSTVLVVACLRLLCGQVTDPFVAVQHASCDMLRHHVNSLMEPPHGRHEAPGMTPDVGAGMRERSSGCIVPPRYELRSSTDADGSDGVSAVESALLSRIAALASQRERVLAVCRSVLQVPHAGSSSSRDMSAHCWCAPVADALLAAAVDSIAPHLHADDGGGWARALMHAVGTAVACPIHGAGRSSTGRADNHWCGETAASLARSLLAALDDDAKRCADAIAAAEAVVTSMPAGPAAASAGDEVTSIWLQPLMGAQLPFASAAPLTTPLALLRWLHVDSGIAARIAAAESIAEAVFVQPLQLEGGHLRPDAAAQVQAGVHVAAQAASALLERVHVEGDDDSVAALGRSHLAAGHASLQHHLTQVLATLAVAPCLFAQRALDTLMRVADGAFHDRCATGSAPHVSSVACTTSDVFVAAAPLAKTAVASATSRDRTEPLHRSWLRGLAATCLSSYLRLFHDVHGSAGSHTGDGGVDAARALRRCELPVLRFGHWRIVGAASGAAVAIVEAAIAGNRSSPLAGHALVGSSDAGRWRRSAPSHAVAALLFTDDDEEADDDTGDDGTTGRESVAAASLAVGNFDIAVPAAVLDELDRVIDDTQRDPGDGDRRDAAWVPAAWLAPVLLTSPPATRPAGQTGDVAASCSVASQLVALWTMRDDLRWLEALASAATSPTGRLTHGGEEGASATDIRTLQLHSAWLRTVDRASRTLTWGITAASTWRRRQWMQPIGAWAPSVLVNPVGGNRALHPGAARSQLMRAAGWWWAALVPQSRVHDGRMLAAAPSSAPRAAAGSGVQPSGADGSSGLHTRGTGLPAAGSMPADVNATAGALPAVAAAPSGASSSTTSTKPVIGRGLQPMPGMPRSRWWDIDAQVEVKKGDKGQPMDASVDSGASTAMPAIPLLPLAPVGGRRITSSGKRRHAGKLRGRQRRLLDIIVESDHEEDEEDEDEERSDEEDSSVKVDAMRSHAGGQTGDGDEGASVASSSSDDTRPDQRDDDDAVEFVVDAAVAEPSVGSSGRPGGDRPSEAALSPPGDTAATTPGAAAAADADGDAAADWLSRGPPEPATDAQPVAAADHALPLAAPPATSGSAAHVCRGATRVTLPRWLRFLASSGDDQVHQEASSRARASRSHVLTLLAAFDATTADSARTGALPVAPLVDAAERDWHPLLPSIAASAAVLAHLRAEHSLAAASVVRLLLLPPNNLLAALWAMRGVLMMEQGHLLHVWRERVFDALLTSAPDASPSKLAAATAASAVLRDSAALTMWLRQALGARGHHLRRRPREWRADDIGLTTDAIGLVAGTLDPDDFDVAVGVSPRASGLWGMSLLAGMQLRCIVSPPVAHYLLTDRAVADYNAIFTHLLKLHWLAWALGEVNNAVGRGMAATHATLRAMTPLPGGADAAAPAWRLLHVLACGRQRLSHFVSAVRDSTMHLVAIAPWQRLTAAIATARHPQQLSDAHSGYLASCRRVCFLDHHQRTAAAAFGRVFTRIEAFAVAALAAAALVPTAVQACHTALQQNAAADAVFDVAGGPVGVHPPGMRRGGSSAIGTAALRSGRAAPADDAGNDGNDADDDDDAASVASSTSSSASRASRWSTTSSIIERSGLVWRSRRERRRDATRAAVSAVRPLPPSVASAVEVANSALTARTRAIAAQVEAVTAAIAGLLQAAAVASVGVDAVAAAVASGAGGSVPLAEGGAGTDPLAGSFADVATMADFNGFFAAAGAP